MGEQEIRLENNRLTELDLLPSQRAIQALYNDLLRPMPPEINQYDQQITGVDPEEVRDRLVGTSMGDILVAQYERLSPDPRYSDFYGVYPGVDATLTGLSIGTYGVMLPKMRLLDAAQRKEFSSQPGVQIFEMANGINVTWPEISEWCGYVSLRFWYQKDPKTEDEEPVTVGEVVQMETWHREPGVSPILQGRIAIPGPYPSDNPRHCPRMGKERPATEDEVTNFVNLIRDVNAT